MWHYVITIEFKVGKTQFGEMREATDDTLNQCLDELRQWASDQGATRVHVRIQGDKKGN